MTFSGRLCQFSPIVNRGDAMSGQAVAVHRAAQEFGLDACLFAFTLGDERSVSIQTFTEYKVQPDDLLILHYGGRGWVEEQVLGLRGRTYLYYHNVTPARFLRRISSPMAEAVSRGRDTLPELAQLGALAASDYNRRELVRAGFHSVHVVPYILDFDAFRRAAQTPEAQAIVARHASPGTVNWLHVGRIAPNKRIEDVIRAFHVYHRRLNPDSRLFLVGSDGALETYSHPIMRWVERLGLGDSVIFTGQVADRNQLAGYYRLATVYVCMSEHEGFCIPLLEAMLHKVPIVAYRSTGVVDTMGAAGVMLDTKDPRVIAEAAQLLSGHQTYRARIIESQVLQAERWHPSRAKEALLNWLATL